MRYAAAVLFLGLYGAHAEAQVTAQCSSYYISEINLVTMIDAQPGNVLTFVGFGLSKEESEKNAVGACSHVRFDLETCLESDRVSGINAPFRPDRYFPSSQVQRAVKRVTGCS